MVLSLRSISSTRARIRFLGQVGADNLDGATGFIG